MKHITFLMIWSISKISNQTYQKSTKSITKALIFTTLDTWRLKKIDDCKNIHSGNPLYLIINQASGYIEEKCGKKYLIFDDSVNENKELLKKYADVWDEIKNEIKTINGGKKNDYGKDYMKIKLNSDDDLTLNKPLKFHAMTIIIRSVFEEGGKLYPQIYLHECLYELHV